MAGPDERAKYEAIYGNAPVTAEDRATVARDATLVDVACGSGAPGLWVSEQTGARLIGIDRSPVGCAARKRVEAKPGVHAEFRVGDMTATGLPAASADAAMSIDAAQLVPRRSDVFREVARILRPGGRFVLSTVLGDALVEEAEWGAVHAPRSRHVFIVCERAV